MQAEDSQATTEVLGSSRRGKRVQLMDWSETLVCRVGEYV